MSPLKQNSLFFATLFMALTVVGGSFYLSAYEWTTDTSTQAAARQALAAYYGAGINTSAIITDPTDPLKRRVRTFTVIVPSGAVPPGGFPLVLLFHGGSGTSEIILAKAAGFKGLVDTERFVLVAPNGVTQSWNDGRGVTAAELAGVDDVAFARTLVTHIKTHLSVNPNYVYATGASNGGMMAYRLGCEAADVFAAVGSVIGNIPTPLPCNPSQPISLIAINGLNDPLIPYNGGLCCLEGGEGGSVQSTQTSVETFANRNGCSLSYTSEKPSIFVNDGTTLEKKTYPGCGAGTSVVSYVVNGMGHSWSPTAPASPTSGSTSKNLYASKVIWNFFKAHPKI